MAPRSASRCCRAVRSSLAGPSSSATTIPDGVWITDSVLASAFARYCQTVTLPSSPGTTRRFASNVPGPLESRRRLGKRQMTDQLSLQLSLNPAGSMLPPAWALPNTPDLRQWQWSPPRDASEWAQNTSLLSRQADTAKSGNGGGGGGTSVFPLFGMPKWLTDLGSEVAEVDNDVIEPQPQQQQARVVTAQQLYTSLQTWREVAATLSETDFAVQLDDICSEYQTQLRLAALTADEARDVFGQIWAVVREKGGDLESHASLLFAAVLEGIRTCPLLQAQDFGVEFWRELHVCVTQLLPKNATVDAQSPLTAAVALDMLLATPPLFLADVADLLPSHLCAIFASHALAAHTITSWDTAARAASTTAIEGTRTHALAEKVAQALQHMDLKQHSNFLETTTELIAVASSSSSSSSTSTSSVFSLPANNSGIADTGISAPNRVASMVASVWLLTLAHIPQVRQDKLYKTMSQLQQSSEAAPPTPETGAATIAATTTTDNNAGWHMRRTELCELLLAQWISRGYVTQQAQQSFRRTMATISAQGCNNQSGQPVHRDHPAALAALALAVFWPKHSRSQCVALYVSLLRGLHTLDHDAATARDELFLSVTALLGHLQAASTSPSTQSASVKAKLPPATFFESLAWAMDDVHAAVRLHELYVSTSTSSNSIPSAPAQAEQDSHSSPVQSLPLWSVGFWDKFADRLAAALDTGMLTAAQVSFALDLSARATQTTQHIKAMRTTAAAVSKTKTKAKTKAKTAYKPAKSLGAPTVALVEKLAVHFALDPNLSPRQALRGVEYCRRFLAAHVHTSSSNSCSSPASSTVMRALFHLITRDLEDAMPGRTTRLRWFLGIVEREYSPAEALASGWALERWRAAAKQIRKEEDRRLLQEARGMLERKN
ncbi:hypothetical protein SCUCBS95973_003735 [Sporothrix curviconia]|uniref:Uncharacterized protein n=1 Tax=Sporothrix curviconia TaxID=1260050 RepID=A0ABP0BHU2_9PEZI